MFRAVFLSLCLVFAPAVPVYADSAVSLNRLSAEVQTLRVVSYNVLAESYLHQEYYPNHDVADMRWELRGPKVVARILELDADILALQEVEPWVFAELNDVLRPLGYEGIYAKKGLGRPDGSATFFRADKLDCLGARTIFYNDDYQGEISGHIALILCLRVGQETVGVINTHIRWSDPSLPPEEQVGYREVKELIDAHLEYSEISEWLVMGDFNAAQGTGVYNLMIDAGFEDVLEPFDQPTVSFKGMGRIDYIFAKGPFIAEPVMGTPIRDSDSLPNAEEPSDHLPITAVFFAVTPTP